MKKATDLSTKEGILSLLQKSAQELAKQKTTPESALAIERLAKVALRILTPRQPSKLEKEIKELRARIEKSAR